MADKQTKEVPVKETNDQKETNDNDGKLVFYGNAICPFAMRALIALTYKNIPYEFKDCELRPNQKQDFFQEAYAKALGHDEFNAGKVPIIQHNGHLITESLVVVRYLDHVYCDREKFGPSLLPNDPFERAAVETMVDWIGNGWAGYHYGILFSLDKETVQGKVNDWKEKKWKILNARLGQFCNEGLYLKSQTLSLFDVAAFPFFERLIVVQVLCELPIMTKWFEEYPRIASWYNAMLKLEVIQKVKNKDKMLVDAYGKYREMKTAQQKKIVKTVTQNTK